MFNRLGKNSEKPQIGVATTPLYVQGLTFFPSSIANASVYSPHPELWGEGVQVFGVMISGIVSVIGFLW